MPESLIMKETLSYAQTFNVGSITGALFLRWLCCAEEHLWTVEIGNDIARRRSHLG
jgi:hypothetical protein